MGFLDHFRNNDEPEYSPYVQEVRNRKQAELDYDKLSSKFKRYASDKAAAYQEARSLRQAERAAMQEQRRIEKAEKQAQRAAEKAQKQADRQAEAEAKRAQREAEREAHKTYQETFDDVSDDNVVIIEDPEPIKPVKIPKTKRITRAKVEELAAKERSSLSGVTDHIRQYNTDRENIKKHYKAGKEDGKAVRAKEQAAKKSATQIEKERKAYEKGYRKGSTSLAERTGEKLQKAGKGAKIAVKTGRKVATEVFDAMEGSPINHAKPAHRVPAKNPSKRIGAPQRIAAPKRILKSEKAHPVHRKTSTSRSINKSKGSPVSRKSTGSINSRLSGNLTKRSSGVVSSRKPSTCITGCNKQKAQR